MFLLEAERQLNALGKVQAANIVGQIPYEPGTNNITLSYQLELQM